MKRHSLVKQFMRFIGAGGMAAAVEYLVFIILSLSPMTNLFTMQFISFMLGAITSFSLNRVWVFESRGGEPRRLMGEVVGYFSLALVNVVITGFIIQILTNDLEWNVYVAKLSVMAMVVAWNFVIFQKIIFRKTK